MVRRQVYRFVLVLLFVACCTKAKCDQDGDDGDEIMIKDWSIKLAFQIGLLLKL